MHSILVLRLSSLGDIVLVTPLLAALRKRYPEARIDLVVSSEYKALAPMIEGASSVIVFDKRTGLAGLHRLRRELRAIDYTHVLDLHNVLRTRFLRLGLGKRVKRAVIDKRTLKRWLMVRYKYDLLQSEPDVIGRYFETARAAALDVTDSPSALPKLLVDASTDSTDSHRIAIAPGARHWNKRWPPEYFAELASELVVRGYHIDFHGSAADRETVLAACGGLPEGSFTNFAGALSIGDAAQAIARAAVAITTDSGLMHVAQAVGVPVISFFGPTVRQFGFAPRSPGSVVLEVEGLYCRPCTAIGLPICPEKHFRCMREITPDLVLPHVPPLKEST